MSLISNESVFYHIYTLGFCNAPEYNDFYSAPQNRIDKVYNLIEHIKDLGCNAVYFGPLFESHSHGYDTVDYFNVDRRLGNNNSLSALCAVLKENNINIVFDGVFNHVGRDFFAFKDLRINKQNSIYIDWFANINFNGNSPFNDGFSYDTWHGYHELIKLNLRNPEVKNYFFNAVKMWIDNFYIDGIRFDAADCLDHDFIRDISAYCKGIKKDFWLMGEIIHGDYRIWANSSMFDSVTNYEGYKGLYSSHNDKNYYEIAYSLNRQFGEHGMYKNISLYNFVDNHDVNRLASTLTNQSYLYPVYGLLFTMPGIPSIYYGSEFGISGKKENGSDKNLRPSIDIEELKNSSSNKDLIHSIKRFSWIRKNSQALKYGNYKQIFISNEQFVFMREYNSEKYLIAVNLSAAEKNIEFSFSEGHQFTDILNNNHKYYLYNKKLKISIPSNWLRIMKVD